MASQISSKTEIIDTSVDETSEDKVLINIEDENVENTTGNAKVTNEKAEGHDRGPSDKESLVCQEMTKDGVHSQPTRKKKIQRTVKENRNSRMYKEYLAITNIMANGTRLQCNSCECLFFFESDLKNHILRRHPEANREEAKIRNHVWGRSKLKKIKTERDILKNTNMEEYILKNKRDLLTDNNKEKNILGDIKKQDNILENTKNESHILKNIKLERDMADSNTEQNISKDTKTKSRILKKKRYFTKKQSHILKNIKLERDVEDSNTKQNIFEYTKTESHILKNIKIERYITTDMKKETHNLDDTRTESRILKKNKVDNHILKNIKIEKDIKDK